MTQYILTTEMSGGFMPEGDSVEAFEATPTDAVDALLDEADQAVGDCECGDPDCTTFSDLALIESLRGAEGRGDLLANLNRYGMVAIGIESYANDFGGLVRLTAMEVTP